MEFNEACSSCDAHAPDAVCGNVATRHLGDRNHRSEDASGGENVTGIAITYDGETNVEI